MLGRSLPGIQDGAKVIADRTSLVLERLVRATWPLSRLPHLAIDLSYTCDVPRMDLRRAQAPRTMTQ